jgi:bifunctional DNA-binding transcriptional regulator/antitoxin component of YhaV-PrlF toxin-antitoxin module
MTIADLIPPLIPPARSRPGRSGKAPRLARPLPLAASLSPAALPPNLLYGLGRIDMSGRVADRTVTMALGWQSGDRLIVTGTDDVVLARRDPAGMVTVAARAYIAIPAPLRRRCGLRAGDRVLLAALPDEDALAAYPMSVIDLVIREFRSGPSPRDARGLS